MDGEIKRRPGRPKGAVKNVVPRKPGRPPNKPTPERREPIPVSSDFKPPVKSKTYYEPWMCDKVIEVAANGGHQAHMIIALGIRSRVTLYEWQDKYPEFKEAMELAKIYSQAYYEDLNLQGTKGEIHGFNVTSLALTMNAKFSDEYKRNSVGGGGGTEININTINLSPTQIDNKIAQLLEKFKSQGLEWDGNVIDAEVVEE